MTEPTSNLARLKDAASYQQWAVEMDIEFTALNLIGIE